MAASGASPVFQPSALGLHPLAPVRPAAPIAAEVALVIWQAISIQ